MNIPKSIVLVSLVVLFSGFTQKKHSLSEYDLIIYGATPSGIMAAINAGRRGHTVLLVEEYEHIGGLMTGGLSFTDFISFEVLGGEFQNYTNRVLAYYTEKYGPDSQQVEDCHFGIHAEPHVTLQIFQEMLREFPGIEVIAKHRLNKVILGESNGGKVGISGVRLIDLNEDQTVEFEAKVFIDATYEGDLAAMAGANYFLGRESQSTYHERFAGKIFTRGGVIQSGSTGEGDQRIQGYNFRVIMTDDPDNRIMIAEPEGYDRNVFTPILETLKNKKVAQIFTEDARGILRVQLLPNRKADINDIKNAPVRMALLGGNYDYPEGNTETRNRIIEDHRLHNLSLIYFLQQDREVPDELRKEAQKWGLAKDEFTDNDYFPYRLYIREARRIEGEYVFTEQDTYMAPNSVRTTLKSDAIAIGDYALNCHGVSPPGELYEDLTEGDFNHVPPPFQIPYGITVVKGFHNLLVSVAVSSSHVGFSALRLEPTWSAIGQATGLAAHLMLENNLAAADVPIDQLQRLIHEAGGKTVYISDVSNDHPYFNAIQYLGTKGLFHQMFPLGDINLKSAPNLWNMQYREAYPYHHIDPEKQVTDELAKSWIRMLNLDTESSETLELLNSKNITRGEFLNRLYQLHSQKR
ncbi:FAD-dependent oxidoreductase [Pleomorphovibrio marinus]|uniref:FAD-dependent oxidoreductase n=1 Tax=Pleomorphovibrio marinus TaxID=2164132 RepID=UPI001300917E|nr:FAD-dependent oxidoreductase [Pleomorphovibrio marinus]